MVDASVQRLDRIASETRTRLGHEASGDGSKIVFHSRAFFLKWGAPDEHGYSPCLLMRGDLERCPLLPDPARSRPVTWASGVQFDAVMARHFAENVQAEAWRER